MTKRARLIGVRADVAEAAARARARRVGAPARPASGRRPRAASPASPGGTRPGPSRIAPSSPAATIVAGLPHHRVAGVVVRQREDAAGSRSTIRASSRASARSTVSGLSQMTLMPASRNASAAAKCRWFGVTIDDGVDAVRAAALLPAPSRRSRRRRARARGRARPPRPAHRSGVRGEAAGDQLVAARPSGPPCGGRRR